VFVMPSTSDILNDIVNSNTLTLPSGRYVDLPADELRSGEYNDVCGHSDVLFENWQKSHINGLRIDPQSVSDGYDRLNPGDDKPAGVPLNGEGDPQSVSDGCPDSHLPTTRPAAAGLVDDTQTECGDSQIWYNGEFISCAEYEKIQSKKDQQKTALYPANVPNTIHDVKTSNIGKIYGSNFLPTNEDCGKIYRKVLCNTDRTHKPANLHIHCNDPLCLVCYKKFAGRIAARVSERVMGYKDVYPGKKKLSSLIFWPKLGTIYENIDAAFDDGKRMLEDMGATGAVIWIHPYRIKKEIQPKLRRIQKQLKLHEKPTKGFWEMAHEDALSIGGLENYYVPGVHFHAQVSGYLEDSKKYSERTGAGYKKKGYLDTGTDAENHKNIQKHAYYVSTHASFESGKDTVRYFGLMSKYNLRRTQTGEYFDNVNCDICGSTLADYEYDAKTKVLSVMPVHSVITRKIKVYKYWIRGAASSGQPGEKFLSVSAHKKKLRQTIDEARAIQNQNLKGWDLL